MAEHSSLLAEMFQLIERTTYSIDCSQINGLIIRGEIQGHRIVIGVTPHSEHLQSLCRDIKQRG